MIEVIKYQEQLKSEWDVFVRSSKNGTFLLQRNYMDYHANRFRDHSLLIYKRGKLVGLLPANETASKSISSHAGLTYGGLVTGKDMKANIMLDVFDALRNHYSDQGFESLYYKTIPSIYHKSPAGEDLYALFINEAELVKRDLLSVIDNTHRLGYSDKRRWRVNKARRASWKLGVSQDLKQFMHVVAELLEAKYNAVPVHSTSEIELLASRFPDNIKLYVANSEQNEIAAGVLVYETEQVAHCQYIGYTSEGKKSGALSALTDYLITEIYPSKPFFDFGTSMLERGTALNQKLLTNKESYGARAVVQDHYLLKF